MKKIFAAALAMCLLLTGCRPALPEATIQTPPATTQAPTTQPAQSQFPEIVLTDNAHCAVTVKSIDPDGVFGYTLGVLLENKTDLELMFSFRGVSVNGYMCDPFFAASVSPGMKANEKVSFPKERLQRSGITEVTDITFTLAVYDGTDLMAEYLVEEEFTVYPLGEEAYRTYERPTQETDTVLFDNEDCAMIVTGFDTDSLWGYAMDVYLENRTQKTVMFSASDVALNGFMCDPYWAVEVAPGKKCYSQVTWSDSNLLDNGITQVETIHLSIRVYDSADWMQGQIYQESFTLTP